MGEAKKQEEPRQMDGIKKITHAEKVEEQSKKILSDDDLTAELEEIQIHAKKPETIQTSKPKEYELKDAKGSSIEMEGTSINDKTS